MITSTDLPLERGIVLLSVIFVCLEGGEIRGHSLTNKLHYLICIVINFQSPFMRRFFFYAEKDIFLEKES